MNDVKFMRDTLYDLKKRHSAEIKIVEITHQEQSNLTGRRLVERRTLTVRKAVRLPNSLLRNFAQDIAYLAANKNFTYGALNDYKTETFIIDCRDLPRTFVPNLNHYIVYKDKRYDVVNIGAGEDQVYLIYISKQTMLDESENQAGVYPPSSDADTVIVETLEEIISYDFAYGDAARAIYTGIRGGTLINVSLRYRNIFNSATSTVVVGFNSDTDALVKATDTDPTMPYEYSIDTDQRVEIGESVSLTITPNGATQGTGIVTLTLSYDNEEP